MSRIAVLAGTLAILAFAIVVASSPHRALGLVGVGVYEADVNKSGGVNSIDLMLVAQRFGQQWTPTATATPAPTPIPEPFEVTQSGPSSTLPGVLVAYTFIVRNAASEPALIDINSFVAPELQDVCIEVGATADGPSAAPCQDAATFNAVGLHVTVDAGHAIWLTARGTFPASAFDTTAIQQATWHYSGNGVAGSGNALVATRVREFCIATGC